MKTIKENGKFKFDYEVEGMVFFGQTDVALLDRKTGQQVVVSIEKLEADLPAAKYKLISADLLMSNRFTNDRYDIVGLG